MGNIPESIPKLIDEKTRSLLSRKMIRNIGFLAGRCVERGIIVKEVEIIMPPMSEYLDFQYRLNDALNEFGHKIVVNIGIQINVPDKKLEDIDINESLDKIANKNFGNN
jgi:hypothetical protein